MRALLSTFGALLCGCSLIVPIRDRTWDLVDAGVPDATVDAAAQCTETCSGLTPVCDVANDRCVGCLTSTDCDDGRACTADRCNLDNTCTSTLDTGCVSQVSVGFSHSCARFASGEVRCWGSNGAGRLGNGMTDSPVLPVRVVGLTDAIDVGAGGGFTCAVRMAGAVLCWGGGLSGQLGDGMSASSPAPVEVMGITDAVQVVTGRAHACARRSGGEVVCWGDGGRGQLGDGSTTDHTSPTAMPVAGLTGVVSLASGADHTCALLDDDSLACWGQNDGSQLGDGTMTMMDQAAPVPVADIADAVQVGDHCARRMDDTVACWGPNNHGQVGDGSTTLADRPAMVMNLLDAIDLASHDDVACARRNTGETVCWGRNDEGQLGIDAMGTDGPVPATVMNLPDALHIAVGRRHCCAVRASGQVVCWGANDMNQVSNTGIANHLIPVTVEGL